MNLERKYRILSNICGLMMLILMFGIFIISPFLKTHIDLCFVCLLIYVFVCFIIFSKCDKYKELIDKQNLK